MLENLFVCIGAQKAGTTWLHTALGRDPIFSTCPYVKEVHYFDLVHRQSPHLNNWRAHHFLRVASRHPVAAKFKFAREMDRRQSDGVFKPDEERPGASGKLDEVFRQLLGPVDDAWYCNLLKPVEGQEWAMDVTPDYAVIGVEGFKHMRTLAEKLRLLFILRDPIERAWSGLLQRYKRKPGGIAGFAETRLHDTDWILEVCTSGPDVGARCDYEATLNAIVQAGLEEHVQIKMYDDIETRPVQFISDVYEHLGLEWRGESPGAADILGKRVHSTEQKLEMPNSVRVGLRDYYGPKIERLAKRLPIPPSWGV